MHYYICTKDGPTIEIKKKITKEEYIRWCECTEKLTYYSRANHFRDMAIQNGIEIENYLKSIQTIADPAIIKKIDVTAIARKANRLMLNYLVSFRTYVDNMQVYSKHIKNGEAFRKNVLNWIYDNEIIYAFFSHLRNFATHFSVIFDHVTIEPNRIILKCSKEHLYGYKEWKNIDKEYINTCPEDSLPILECVEHMNVLLMSIYLGFVSYFATDIQEMHNQVMPLMHEYQILNPFFLESESETDFSSAEILGLGLDVLKKATDELAQLPNVNITYITQEQILKGEI